MQKGEKEEMKIFEILKKKRENVSISFDQIVEKWLEYKKMNIKVIHSKKIGYFIIQSFFLFYYNEQAPAYEVLI